MSPGNTQRGGDEAPLMPVKEVAGWLSFPASWRSAFYRSLDSVAVRPDGVGVMRYVVPCVVGNESVWPS